MSTHALVGCLMRWGHLSRARGGMELTSDQAPVKGLLQAVLDTARGSANLAWTFFVDLVVCWGLPRLPCGLTSVHVQVNVGVMDLAGWEACRCGYRRAVSE